jgi:homoserine dehydrogenase
MNKVKIGLIGLGNIGRTHVGYLQTMDNIELVGVCDLVKAYAAFLQKTERYRGQRRARQADEGNLDQYRLVSFPGLLRQRRLARNLGRRRRRHPDQPMSA